MSHEKISNLISFSRFVFIFIMKLTDFDFMSHWNTTIFCDQWKTTSDLNIFPWKISDFVSVPLFTLNFLMKLRGFDFTSHWDTLLFLGKKGNVRFEFFLLNIVWFCLIFFVGAHFWQKKKKEMRILKFIEIL